MRTTILLVAIVAALGACGGEQALRFTAIPHRDTTDLTRKFTPVAEYLEAKLGVPVVFVASTDYAASVEMFKNGEVQLAWFGGLTGVQARHAVEGARAIVQGRADPTFRSYLIAHKDTGLPRSDEFPAGIADRRFTFGSNSSTSGRLMPEFFLIKHTGKTAEDFFTTPPAFSGSHDQTAELVESGQFEVGAINYKVYDQRVAEGKTDPDVCRILWVTPPFADYNMTAHPDLDTAFGAGFIDRLRDALIGIDDPELLAAFDREKLIPAANEDFEGVERVAVELGMLR